MVYVEQALDGPRRLDKLGVAVQSRVVHHPHEAHALPHVSPGAAEVRPIATGEDGRLLVVWRQATLEERGEGRHVAATEFDALEIYGPARHHELRERREAKGPMYRQPMGERPESPPVFFRALYYDSPCRERKIVWPYGCTLPRKCALSA